MDSEALEAFTAFELVKTCSGRDHWSPTSGELLKVVVTGS